MKKTFLLGSLLLCIFLALFLFIPRSVLADGMGLTFDSNSDRWDYSDESNQQAFINYENGLQKMIISVDFEAGNSEGVVWLFPIPSEPNKVAIDVLKNLPKLSGEEISKKAKSNLDNATTFLQMTQIYTIPLVMMSQSFLGATSDFENTLSTTGIGESVKQDVVVYEHLEKEGLTSEIITAKTANGLYDYLKSKGLKIENGSIPVLDNYIGKDYSFVVSWIANPQTAISTQEIVDILYQVNRFQDQVSFPKVFELMSNLHQKYPDFDLINIDYKNSRYYPEYLKSERGQIIQQEMILAIQNDSSLASEASKMSRIKYKTSDKNGERYVYLSNQKGVFVTFPTKEIYFPLLPTSVYGNKTVPATLRIIGHVSPRIFQDIESYTKTEYYLENYVSFADDDLKNFYDGPDRNIKYTKIDINAPSKFFTDDLWINNQAPAKTYYTTLVANFIEEHALASIIILLILFSAITGILAGMIFFKDLRKNPAKLGLIGLSNCLTLFGLLITTALVGTKNKNESLESLLAEIKQKGYFWKRRIATILFFVAAPFLVAGLFVLPGFIDALPGLGRSLDIDDIISILIIYILPITAIFAGFIVKRIKIDDKNLFEQLKSAEYSSWTFQPKDKMKYAFVPIFSISFLVVSWLLIELVKLTV